MLAETPALRNETTGEAMAEEIGLFEAIHTQRAIRYLKPDPVPDELITRLLDAAIRAPNAANYQRWAFIVIKDPESRRRIAEGYRALPKPVPRADMTPSEQRRAASEGYLWEHFHEVPVFIVACVRHDGSPSDISRGASIYPAVQNILLAARALGLGAALSTWQRRRFEKEMKELVGIPDDVETAALLPIGFPITGARYGPTTRRPVEEVTFYERWGARG